jgi:hypothetical protein
MKVTEKEDVTKKTDSTKDKEKDTVKEIKETKDADTLTFEGKTALILFLLKIRKSKSYFKLFSKI